MTDEVSRAIHVADKLHSAAIHLLRRLRRQDPESGLSAARLSALSVIVFNDGITMGELAEAEQVRLPTISRLVDSLERDGLARREADAADRRVTHVRVTEQGARVLGSARNRRIEYLATALRSLPHEDLETLDRAADIMERLFTRSGDG